MVYKLEMQCSNSLYIVLHYWYMYYGPGRMLSIRLYLRRTLVQNLYMRRPAAK